MCFYFISNKTNTENVDFVLIHYKVFKSISTQITFYFWFRDSYSLIFDDNIWWNSFFHNALVHDTTENFRLIQLNQQSWNTSKPDSPPFIFLGNIRQLYERSPPKIGFYPTCTHTCRFTVRCRVKIRHPSLS